jgi:hypothetical protein
MLSPHLILELWKRKIAMTVAPAASSIASNESTHTTSKGLSPIERYLFDLRGYFVLPQAIAPDLLGELNGTLDRYVNMDPPLEHGEWIGGVQAHSFGGDDGVNLQQIYEAGPAFQQLIDHPSWYHKVLELIGSEHNFDNHHGPMFIDENFASLRGPGQAIGMHSGKAEGSSRIQYRYEHDQFHCAQINVLMALTDIGPGDGGTMLIPGSHKSNMRHPDFDQHVIKQGQNTSGDGLEGAIEVHMKAGDVLVFVDATCHGSARRINDGRRRVVVYRYGPSWGFFRHPYRPSAELLVQLTERQRKIVWPHQSIPRTPNRIPNYPSPQRDIQ